MDNNLHFNETGLDSWLSLQLHSGVNVTPCNVVYRVLDKPLDRMRGRIAASHHALNFYAKQMLTARSKLRC